MPEVRTKSGASGIAATYWAISKEHRGAFLGGALSMLAVNLLELLPPLVLGRLIDSFMGVRGSWSVGVLAAGYVSVFFIQAALRYPLRSGFIGTSLKIAATLRENYASRLLRVSRASIASHSSGDLISRMTSDLGLIEGALATGVPFLFDCSIYLLILPATMVIQSPKLALAAFAVLPAIPVMAGILIHRISNASEAVQEGFARLVSKAHENAVSVQTIRAYGLGSREGEVFQSLGAEFVRRDRHRARLESVFSGSVQALIALSMGMVLWFGSREAIGGGTSPGRFITFFQYSGMMAWPLTGLAWAALLFRKGTIGLRRMEQILRLPDEDSGGIPVPAGNGSLEVRDLTYVHPEVAVPALSSVSFVANAGERVALVGALGSGKSTLLNLLSRTIEPPAGSVWMDGVDVTTIDLGEFRRRIGMAPQDPFLFSGTIRENLAMLSVEPESVGRAASDARIEGEEFGAGLDTRTGEKGASLSGGQRQRVAVARALARRPPILILDDATSALDQATESAVFEGLGKGTVLFSTHRTALARKADRVVVLDQGRIVEQGAPDGLLHAGGLFASMSKRESFSESLDHA